jgi:UPF0755 protein
MKKTIVALLLMVAVVAGARALIWNSYHEFLSMPLALPETGYVFQLEPGMNGKAIVRRLEREGFTEDDWRWKLLMRIEPRIYRAGEYLLESGFRPRDVLVKLSGTDVVQYRFTLVEGWTFGQLAGALGQDPVLEDDLDLSQPYAWDPGTLFEGMEHPEGWFLPETYSFTRGDGYRDILERAYASMNEALDEAWRTRDTGLPLASPYQLLILASIIEKETALEEERGEIAGVFVRRLEKGMRLQTDPTVIYGMGEQFDGDIRRRDLKTDTPYNTYTRHGLPPTPIAMPGRASLLAAAHPADGETLYFVADGNGGHTFSKTLAEHQAAVDRLLGRN